MNLSPRINFNNHPWIYQTALITTCAACAVSFYPVIGGTAFVTGIVIIVATVAISTFKQSWERGINGEKEAGSKLSTLQSHPNTFLSSLDLNAPQSRSEFDRL
jgi:hypothetical protein